MSRQAAGEVRRAGMQSQENGGPGPAVLRFRARLERGATASSPDHALTPESEPEAPYMATLGGPGFRIDGNRLSSHQELWLWPFPEPGNLTLEITWPEFGLSGAAIPIEVD